jgi:hypothetical protein
MLYSDQLMTRKEAQARVGMRDLTPKELEELENFATDIYARVLGPDWRNFPANRAKPKKYDKR